MSTVYLFHFTEPIAPGKHTAQHYIGFAEELETRLAEQRAGGLSAARLLQVAKERHIDFVVARTWPGDRALERQLKNRHNAPQLCPICLAEKARLQAALEFTLDDVPELEF